jgi:hypothetical protein
MKRRWVVGRNDDVGGDEQVRKSEGGVTESGQGGCRGADGASALIRQQPANGDGD